MISCDHLVHPFQNDQGISQRQRIMDDLLSSTAKIDGRTLADLLDYFIQMSRHINYYDSSLNVSDWQPFFKKSIPFTLSAIIKFETSTVQEKFQFYNSLFEKYPSKAGLQLNFSYFFYSIIYQFNKWHVQIKSSGLPVESVMEKLIQDRLRTPLKSFIYLMNTAAKANGIQRFDFFKLAQNEVWDLQLTDLYSIENCFSSEVKGKKKQLVFLHKEIKALFPSFIEAAKILSGAAELSLDQSLLPLKEELQKNHPPHLGLLFTFLRLFQHLQADLNGFTKKHLDFFYKDVLQIKPKETVPDQAHVIFEIQNHLKKYLLKKGLLLTGGKDNNKADISFALDDELIVNKTQVAEVRTLFVNNESIYGQTYLEGVYCAPKANASDGIEKEFKDTEPNNYPTLGNKYSKYIAPGKTSFQQYPNARLGFILASPVLLLNEGTRTIDILLAGELNGQICKDKFPTHSPDQSCCENTDFPVLARPKYPDFLPSDQLFNEVNTYLKTSYHIITEDLIRQAISEGLNEQLGKTIREEFLEDECKKSMCLEHQSYFKDEAVITTATWKSDFYDLREPGTKYLLDEIFKERRVFKILLSGEKEWIEPVIDVLEIIPDPTNANKFSLQISLTLDPKQSAVTFYNKENLKEDFNTTLPLVKIELDDSVKIPLDNLIKDIEADPENECCLFKPVDLCGRKVSLYHFFRNIVLDTATKIDVKVCGVKNFVVQNDESVMDVNNLIHPFGVRPKVDSNFYIGPEEIFLKKWNDINVNLNWKDLPSDFNRYYDGYQSEYWDSTTSAWIKIGIVEKNKFKVRAAVLHEGKWNIQKPANNVIPENCDSHYPLLQLYTNSFCETLNYTHQFQFNKATDFETPLSDIKEEIIFKGLKKLDVNTRHGFIKLSLKCQDFQHELYPIVLSRQLAAFGKLPELVDGAVYYKITSPNNVTIIDINELFDEIISLSNDSDAIEPNVEQLISRLIAEGSGGTILNIIWNQILHSALPIPPPPFVPINPPDLDHSRLYMEMKKIFDWLNDKKNLIENFKCKGVVIPNEPWTPIIKNIALDYTATALIEDISIIHLYPFTGTYKTEEIGLRPSLFPTFCDEGTLFIGLKDLVPDSNLNLLFQMAEATADSEAEKENVYWAFLDNNQWKPLRNDFEVLEDATDGLTTSGIVNFALPGNFANDNTILPKGIYWIKAALPQNSTTVSETIGIHAQAMRVTFTNETANDKLRLAQTLNAGSIAKLKEADASIKKVTQPYGSFGGRIPETEGHYYIRVSELLRHKGRAIQKFDYERLALEAFPAVYKAKCINHSFALDAHIYKNDFPVAPGYVLLAVIPDLNKLQAGNSFEPKAPVSLLEQVETYFKKRASPFIRLSVMNPRYEKVNFCLKVKLIYGKDENYYKEKLQQDLREFLAPWAVGEYDKLTFGQPVTHSDVVGLIETRDYVDYVIALKMWSEFLQAPTEEDKLQPYILPMTPRSILIAGEIEVCVCQNDCEDWDEEGACENAPEPIVDYCNEGIYLS